jgi:hypothetical protein
LLAAALAWIGLGVVVFGMNRRASR